MKIETIGPATIVLGNCLDELDWALTGAAIVSDPPYGINYVKGPSGSRGMHRDKENYRSVRSSTKVIGDDKPFDPTPWTSHPNVLLWGANHFYSRLPPIGRWLAWNKLEMKEPWDSFSDVEFAWHSRPGPSRIKSLLWKGLACRKMGEDGGKRWHPTLKPIGLMTWCLRQVDAQPGDLIVDPYMGSGSTGVACIRTSHLRFLGFEIDPHHYAIAKERLLRELTITREGKR